MSTRKVPLPLFSRVSRYFRGTNPDGSEYDDYFDGTILAFNSPYYRIIYDDGDIEDLLYREALQCIKNYEIRYNTTNNQIHNKTNNNNIESRSNTSTTTTPDSRQTGMV